MIPSPDVDEANLRVGDDVDSNASRSDEVSVSNKLCLSPCLDQWLTDAMQNGLVKVVQVNTIFYTRMTPLKHHTSLVVPTEFFF